VDYFQYKGQRSNGDLALQESAVTGLSPGEGKELGTEFDYGFEYRYSGLVTVRGSINVFSPGAAFAPDTQQKAQSSNLELSLKF
jgi:hypothetical protein